MMNISRYREMLGCWSFIRSISCTEREQSVSVSTALLHVQPRGGPPARVGRDVCARKLCSLLERGQEAGVGLQSGCQERREQAGLETVLRKVTVRKVLRKQTRSGSRNGLLDSVARWAIVLPGSWVGKHPAW